MTIWEHYNKLEDLNTESPVSMDYYVGNEVLYITGYDEDGSEIWSLDTKTVVEYDDNTCGDGCCNGFILSGIPNEIFWAGQLKVVR